MDILKHHGILGQKWGVRRFQNKDGSLTVAGRLRYGSGVKTYSNDSKRANDIYKTLSKKEKYYLTGEVGDENSYEKQYQNDEDYRSTIYSAITEIKDVPVSVLDVYGVRLDNKAGRIAIATRNDEKYRNVGVASASVEKVLKWFDDNPDILELEWDALTENTKSWKLAEKFGFERDEYESYGGVEVYKKLKPERKEEYDKKRIYDNERVSKEIKRYIDDVDETIAIKEKNKKEHKKDSLVSIKTLEKDKKAYNMIFSHPEYYLNEKGQLYYNGRYYTNVWLLANDLIRNMK